jgi:hypothetical protein
MSCLPRQRFHTAGHVPNLDVAIEGMVAPSHWLAALQPEFPRKSTHGEKDFEVSLQPWTICTSRFDIASTLFNANFLDPCYHSVGIPKE